MINSLTPARSIADSTTPRFIDFHRLLAEYGIPKSKARQLIADGFIQAIHLVNRGRSRGRMLIVVKSIEDYLERISQEQGITI